MLGIEYPQCSTGEISLRIFGIVGQGPQLVDGVSHETGLVNLVEIVRTGLGNKPVVLHLQIQQLGAPALQRLGTIG